MIILAYIDFFCKVWYNESISIIIGMFMKVNILKNVFAIILASFIGIMANPELLMASDSVDVIGVDDSRAVETVIVKEPVTEEVAVTAETVVAPTAPKAGTQVASVVKAATVAAPVQTTPANNAKFSWGTQELFVASSTSVNAGNKVARFRKLIWGHNYTAFGNITKLAIGNTFTLTENGKTTTYRVVANPIDGRAGVALELKNGVLSYNGTNIGMNALTDMGFGGHSLVLMTCYGSGRYVVVADAV